MLLKLNELTERVYDGISWAPDSLFQTLRNIFRMGDFSVGELSISPASVIHTWYWLVLAVISSPEIYSRSFGASWTLLGEVVIL